MKWKMSQILMEETLNLLKPKKNIATHGTIKTIAITYPPFAPGALQLTLNSKRIATTLITHGTVRAKLPLLLRP